MASKKSEGPFVVVNQTGGANTFQSDGQTVTYAIYFKTREAVDKYLDAQRTSAGVFSVFEALSKVTFSHEINEVAYNGK